ncbi:hypothetical protein BP5796_12277 [Coleophoma crateriformis]|uniref:Uncharacterized protein n=1 Tax=Coleophoma crateriformis TaxID=565419 RepID=A0A3D8Q9L2_9HELO|nr:hypothetical protein BP5796_12277 [Coleophoma crateriformis]
MPELKMYGHNLGFIIKYEIAQSPSASFFSGLTPRDTKYWISPTERQMVTC